MQTLSAGDTVVVTLGPGEEIITSLLEAAAAHDIKGGSVAGIGSTSKATIAFFDPKKKEYVPRSFEEPMEIGNLVGNVSALEGVPHVHIHVTVCGPELLAFTGHLVSGVVGTACEIYIRRLGRQVTRVKDPAAGFNPLKLK
ncbi:MAG: PPC domain-containing DNA-binding protein [Planctomycetota bacterium]|jgi:predicted DNA-binding protein with PD1-like motif